MVERHFFHASYGAVNVSGGTGIDPCRFGKQVSTSAMAMVEYGNWQSPGHFSSFLNSQWGEQFRAYSETGFKFQGTFKISLRWSEFHKDASNSIYDQKQISHMHVLRGISRQKFLDTKIRPKTENFKTWVKLLQTKIELALMEVLNVN